MFELLLKRLKTPWHVFFYTGLILILFAASDAVYKTDLMLKHPELIYPIFAVGVLLMIFATFLTYFEASKSAPASKPEINPSSYGVNITSPNMHAIVPAPVKLSGTIKKLPANGLELWVISVGSPSSMMQYWPAEKVVIAQDKKWTANYNPGTFKNNDRRVLKFYLIGPDGRALVRAYKGINKELSAVAGRGYTALTELTSDFVECAEIQVLLKN